MAVGKSQIRHLHIVLAFVEGYAVEAVGVGGGHRPRCGIVDSGAYERLTHRVAHEAAQRVACGGAAHLGGLGCRRGGRVGGRLAVQHDIMALTGPCYADGLEEGIEPQVELMLFGCRLGERHVKGQRCIVNKAHALLTRHDVHHLSYGACLRRRRHGDSQQQEHEHKCFKCCFHLVFFVCHTSTRCVMTGNPLFSETKKMLSRTKYRRVGRAGASSPPPTRALRSSRLCPVRRLSRHSSCRRASP